VATSSIVPFVWRLEISVGELKVQLTLVLVLSWLPELLIISRYFTSLSDFLLPNFRYYTMIDIVHSKKCRILDVVYNASNNELVRTKTLVKNSIIQVDATPFRAWYEQHYGVKIGVKKSKKGAAAESAEKKSSHLTHKLEERQKTRTLDPALDELFASGRLLACISSRPGQSGRCDGYILEGKELEFYAKQLKRKKQ
jgi:ribosomal protein S8E